MVYLLYSVTICLTEAKTEAVCEEPSSSHDPPLAACMTSLVFHIVVEEFGFTLLYTFASSSRFVGIHLCAAS